MFVLGIVAGIRAAAAQDAPAPVPATGASGVVPVGAQAVPLSLDEALRRGAERNLELAAGAYDPAIAFEEIRAAEGLFDTLLTATFEGGRRGTTSNLTFTGSDVVREDFADVSVGVSRRFCNGGRLSAVFSADRLRTNSAIAATNPAWTSGVSVEYAHPLLRGAGDVAMADLRRARSAARAADHGLHALTDDVLLRIETAYWELAFATALVRARAGSEAVADSLVSVTNTRFEARVASVLDVSDARAGLEARRGDRILAEATLRKAEDTLAALVMPFDAAGGRGMRLVATDDPRVVPRSDVLDPAAQDRYVAQALRGRPDLLAARAGLETQDVDVDVARNDLLPQLDLVARLSTGGLDRGILGSFEETGSGQAVSGTLGVELSVYVGRRTASSRLRIAQMVRRQGGIRLQESENRIVQEVRAALHDLVAAKARATTAAGEIGAARESVEGEQLKEKHGESTPFRVLEKEDVLTQAVTREDRASVDVRIATARLWKAIGMLREARRLPMPTACR